ncbi:MAG: FUSC family protein, partial [Demequina sp.]|uniref:FUSC family protein n=1 Tax=Demequina sp. TaxID=2050685 RepID=UPI003A89F5CC
MTPPAGLTWSWSGAARGLVLALPAVATAIAVDPRTGLALAVGVLPAAALGVKTSRRDRSVLLGVGVLAGLSLWLGSLVASLPVLAVVLVLGLSIGVAWLVAVSGRPMAMLALMLGLPLYGAGLSVEAPSTALAGAALMVAGALYAVAVSWAWPGGDGPADTGAPAPGARGSAAPSRRGMLVYGAQVGLAGAVAAACGFATGVDHPGWGATAAMLVSRPDPHALRARAWGRGLSVLAGGVVAAAIISMQPVAGMVAAVLAVLLAVATGLA